MAVSRAHQEWEPLLSHTKQPLLEDGVQCAAQTHGGQASHQTIAVVVRLGLLLHVVLLARLLLLLVVATLRRALLVVTALLWTLVVAAVVLLLVVGLLLRGIASRLVVLRRRGIVAGILVVPVLRRTSWRVVRHVGLFTFTVCVDTLKKKVYSVI